MVVFTTTADLAGVAVGGLGGGLWRRSTKGAFGFIGMLLKVLDLILISPFLFNPNNMNATVSWMRGKTST